MSMLIDFVETTDRIGTLDIFAEIIKILVSRQRDELESRKNDSYQSARWPRLEINWVITTGRSACGYFFCVSALVLHEVFGFRASCIN